MVGTRCSLAISLMQRQSAEDERTTYTIDRCYTVVKIYSALYILYSRPGRIMPEFLPIMLFYYSQKLHLLFLYILPIIPKNNPVTAC